MVKVTIEKENGEKDVLKNDYIIIGGGTFMNEERSEIDLDTAVAGTMNPYGMIVAAELLVVDVIEKLRSKKQKQVACTCIKESMKKMLRELETQPETEA